MYKVFRVVLIFTFVILLNSLTVVSQEVSESNKSAAINESLQNESVKQANAKELTGADIERKYPAGIEQLVEEQPNGEELTDVEIQRKYPKGIEQVIKEEKKEKYYELSYDSYFRYMPSCDTNAMDGKMDIVMADAEYAYEVKLFKLLPLRFALETKYIGIHNQQNEVYIPGKLTGFITDFETTLPFFFKNTYYRIGISPSWFSDHWVFDTSNFRVPSRQFVIYQPNDKLTIIAGVAVFPDFKDPVAPIFGCIYKPNDKLAFNLIPTRPNITYALTDKLRIFGETDFKDEEYEVTRNEKKTVVLRYVGSHIGGGIKFKVNKFIDTTLSCGGVFNRYLKYRDGVGKVNIDNGFYSEFRLEAKI